jgi:predicted NAD-dependent protein-ADP-ribosyltransferase YbiA (DUF1768 family)
MNIGSGNRYPANSLSNFSPHPFVIDGVNCNSMEGFLQSLKFKNPDMQVEVCKMVGKQAKFKGKPKKWWRTQTLWWKGVEIDRHGDEYQELLDRAYWALCKNTKFKKALLASGNSALTHSLGNKDPRRTILSVREFCGRLYSMRAELQRQKEN